MVVGLRPEVCVGVLWYNTILILLIFKLQKYIRILYLKGFKWSKYILILYLHQAILILYSYIYYCMNTIARRLNESEQLMDYKVPFRKNGEDG